MKQLLFILSTLVFATRADAQAAPPSPQFINTVYSYSGDSLLSLEKTTGSIKNKMRYFGVGGGPSYVMEGPRSSIRVKAGPNTRFVVKLSGMMDPSAMIKLYRFDSQKKNRETSVNQGNKNLVDCNIQKSGADVYIFIPTTPLTPGEYGFQNVMMMNGSGMQMSYTFFAFGID